MSGWQAFILGFFATLGAISYVRGIGLERRLRKLESRGVGDNTE